MWHRETKYKER